MLGTMALEMIEQCPDVDAIIVPTGGAGLLAGKWKISKTFKNLKYPNSVYFNKRHCCSS
jgi:threonine dehydratase